MNVENQNLIVTDSETYRLEALSVEFLQILPILFLFFIFYTSKDALLSLLLYELFLIAIPLIYLKFQAKTQLKPFFQPLFMQNWRNSVIYGIPISISIYFVCFGLFSWIFASQVQYLITYQFLFPHNEVLYIMIFPIFTLVNPFLSEIYWRIIPLNTVKKPNKIRMCFYYGFFHGLVVYILKDSLNGLLFFAVYTALAWFFTFLKEKGNIITAIFAHIGLNLSLSIAFILIINEQRKVFS